LYSSFEYFKPKTMSEVVSLIKMLEGEADFLAGGTDLLLSIKRGEKKPSALVDISGLSELHNLYIKDGKLHIGSMTTFATLAISPVVEKYAIALKMAALEMGSPQIRNMATIGGNIATASPAGDSLPALIAHNAFVVLAENAVEYELPIEEYLKTRKKWQSKKSIITGVVISCDNHITRGAFVKLGRRNSLSIARISAACILKRDESGKAQAFNLVLGAVGEIPIRVTETDIIIASKTPKFDTFLKVADAAAEAVRRSIPGRASLPYKEKAVIGVVLEALDKVFYG